MRWTVFRKGYRSKRAPRPSLELQDQDRPGRTEENLSGLPAYAPKIVPVSSQAGVLIIHLSLVPRNAFG
jgi:hypothetical protein